MKSIEPRRTIDDFLDWLKVKPDQGSSDIPPIGDIPTQTLKGVDNAPTRPVIWLVMGVGLGFILASCFFFNALPSMHKASEEVTPAPTVTATQQVIVEKSGIPSPCSKALAAMQKYLESAAKITSVNNAQLDIMSDAYQAILMKDWKRLNEIEERQRQLERTLAAPKVEVMEPYTQVKAELDECLSLTGHPQRMQGTR